MQNSHDIDASISLPIDDEVTGDAPEPITASQVRDVVSRFRAFRDRLACIEEFIFVDDSLIE